MICVRIRPQCFTERCCRTRPTVAKWLPIGACKRTCSRECADEPRSVSHALLDDQAIILGMCPNPELQHSIGYIDGECRIVRANSDRVKPKHPFEMQRRMLRNSFSIVRIFYQPAPEHSLGALHSTVRHSRPHDASQFPRAARLMISNCLVG